MPPHHGDGVGGVGGGVGGNVGGSVGSDAERVLGHRLDDVIEDGSVHKQVKVCHRFHLASEVSDGLGYGKDGVDRDVGLVGVEVLEVELDALGAVKKSITFPAGGEK